MVIAIMEREGKLRGKRSRRSALYPILVPSSFFSLRLDGGRRRDVGGKGQEKFNVTYVIISFYYTVIGGQRDIAKRERGGEGEISGEKERQRGVRAASAVCGRGEKNLRGGRGRS